jgi:hypothetical protein
VTSFRRITARLNYANVVATLALFVALGGTGYAISKLPKDSVKSKQIAANAVKSPEVADGSLISEDFVTGALPPGPRGQAGQDGADGQPGIPGPTFAASKPGPSPVAIPDFVDIVSTPITTPSAGRLLVMYTVNADASGFAGMRVDCTVGTPTVGLYVDGTPLPGTQFNMQDNIRADESVFGITSGVVPAGTHLLEVSADCSAGSPNSANISPNNSLGAILLGS